ncbi:MAG: radical SAM protein, partial [Deltaproteobacteria bacterium]|nr:radical SAM protein [Deltaproteobacteria bacterium]
MVIKELAIKNSPMLTAVVANQAGYIFELEGYTAVGMAGSQLSPLMAANTRKMPYGSELMYLPDRKPVLYNPATGKYETLKE